ncbi:Tn3 family transposase [Pseudomonas syringae pv. daphniphylli]|uniref:Tn3 family transposase n=1 Tax=Pseudomonas syringae pv. daphniphylli TaxID=264455 RepID=A0A9X0KVF9_PSESX|nr:Tn3 family transposase [Pseudomonas syringae pv. daphniphylli]
MSLSSRPPLGCTHGWTWNWVTGISGIPAYNPDLYQYLSTLGWEHINLTGDYVWRQSRKLEDGKFRPLRQLGKP